MINNIIMSALSSINVPKSFMKYNGTASTYIVFFVFNEAGQEYADNNETATQYNVQISVFSKTDYTSLVESVMSAMKAAGFSRTSAIDLFDDNKNTAEGSIFYHKAIRFVYTKVL